MDAKFWLVMLIIGLICAIYFIPQQTTDTVKSGGDKIKSIVGSVLDKKCPDTKLPVCGVNGITYQNLCYAQQAKVNYTEGECGAKTI